MTSLSIISDTHRKHRELTIPECDILIHCGDFCSFQRDDEQTLEDVDEWFAEAPAKKIICIGGNHDFPLQNREFRFEHATMLEDSLIEVNDISIYGSPWCPDLSGFAYYANEEELIEKWKNIPSGVDVLITHTPPHGILDLPTSKSVHLGCPHLLHELERNKPRLHVFGHVHASHGSYTKSGISFINASIVGGQDFEVRHNPTIISL